MNETSDPGEWTLLVDPRNLMGVAEVARHFNVNPSTVSNWSARRASNGMPMPVTSLDCGTVYDIAQLVPWWINWRPIKGRKVGNLPISLPLSEVFARGENRLDVAQKLESLPTVQMTISGTFDSAEDVSPE